AALSRRFSRHTLVTGTVPGMGPGTTWWLEMGLGLGVGDLLGEEGECARDARILAAGGRERRKLLEAADDEAGGGDRVNELGQRPELQPPERLRPVADDDLTSEVVVAPAEGRRVDARARRVEVDREQSAADPERGGRLVDPSVQVVQVGEQS